MRARRLYGTVLPVLFIVASGCSSDPRKYASDGGGGGGDGGDGGGESAIGGKNSATKTTAAGGKAASGGSSSKATGGTSASGGVTSSSTSDGGTAAAGGSVGTSTGGSTTSSGGTTANPSSTGTTGGMTSKGGATAAGGITSSGGATAAGGMTSSGGATAAGGITSSGGSTATTVVCATGTQDNDKNGTCLPTCATAVLSCGTHSICSDTSGTAKCTCVHGYVDIGGACIWGSVPSDPGFLNSPAGAWTMASGATLAPTSVGLVDDGNVVFDRTTICTGNGSASQSVTMPAYANAEPMQIEVSSQGSCTSGSGFCSFGRVNVFFNGGAIGFVLPSNYTNQTRCLGERAFGTNAPMIVRHGSRGVPCSTSVSAYTASVDHVQIKPNAACPAPRTIANADFEGTANWVGSGSGTSAIVAGAGVGASRGWQVKTTAGACSSAAVKGDLSFPIAGGAALGVSLNGTAGTNLNFGDPSGPTWGQYIAPSLTYATQTICIPQYAKGMVQSLQFSANNLPNGGACAAGDGRTFNIDNLSLTNATTCPADTSIIDPGFEISNGVLSYWATSLNFNGVAGSVTAQILTDAANAHGGTHALLLTTKQACTSATAATVLSVPAPIIGAGPALKFYYKGGSTNGSASVSAGTASVTLATQSAYTQQTVCLDPAAAGEGVSLTFRMYGNGSLCATSFADTQLYVDDLQVTTDASCPVR